MHFDTPPRVRPLTPALRLQIAVAAVISLTAFAAMWNAARAQSQLPPMTVETKAKKAQAKTAIKAAESAPTAAH